MAASITDLLTQATVNSRPTPTTVSSPRTAAATTLQCLALTGWATGSAIHFITYKINTAGAKIAGSQCDWKGIVSGTTITGLVLKAGTDLGNAVGDVVECAPTAGFANDLYTWGTANHDTLGNHKDLTGSNSKTVFGITDGAATVNNLRATAANTGSDPQLTAEGTDSNVNLALKPKGTGVVKVDGSVPRQMFQNAMSNFVESGCVWTADAAGSTLNASMTAGFVWVAGQRITVALITARAFTLSKDTYIDVDNTGTVFYTEVANNAASPALTAGRVRIATVVSGATNIAASTSIGQGGFANIVPVISSQVLKGFDSLGNIVYPKGPAAPQLTTNPYKFSVYRTAGMTSSAAEALVPFDTKAFDTGGNVDVVTNKGRFTAPVAGFYHFDGAAGNTAATGTIMYCVLYKNGSAVKYGMVSSPSVANNKHTVSGFLQLAAGDYVELFFIGGGGSAMSVGQANTYFEGFLVSAS